MARSNSRLARPLKTYAFSNWYGTTQMRQAKATEERNGASETRKGAGNASAGSVLLSQSPDRDAAQETLYELLLRLAATWVR